MDAYEATKIVYQRIQNLDPLNASKIMGFLLIQDHGEKEMIRLAFGPESLVQSVSLQAKKELNLASSKPSTPPTPSSPSPFSNPLSLSRQNSCPSSSSRMIAGVNLPSSLSIANHSSSSWTNSSCFSDDSISPSAYNGSSPSTMNSAAAPFYGGGEVDLIDELQLQDQLSFLNDGPPHLGPKSSDFFYHQQQDLASSTNGTDPLLFPSYLGSWGAAAAVHRRSCSVNDICLGSDDLSGGFGWKPCLFYARGFCKNGSGCRFLHGENGGAVDGGAVAGSPNKFENMASSNFPYSPFPANKCLNFLQQQLPPDSPRGLMTGDGMSRFERSHLEVNPGSRQIYLTFPADSTFKEEDVSSYFSNFGPVQDVRIPYQQKRMFGFVTFDYPETVKLILAKGNPHFVCDARVLVKRYKEKGKIPDKHRKQMERGEFTICGSPTGLESRDSYDLHLGARVFYNTQDMLWRRKLEEQADLQNAIELQNRRLMGLHLLDVKKNGHHRTLSSGPTTFSPTFLNQTVMHSNPSSPEAKENGSIGTAADPAYAAASDSKDNGDSSPPNDSDLQESPDHNLPDSPFASPKAFGDFSAIFSTDTISELVENGSVNVTAPSTNNNLIMAPFKSCYFQAPRFASGHETIGM